MPEKFIPQPFSCDVAREDGRALVRPAGELDMSSAPTLERCLQQARDGGPVVVDLRGLEFMDSTGLSLLMRWALEAQREGFEFALIPGSERVQRLFALTKLSSHFRFVDG